MQPVVRQGFCNLKWLISYTEGTCRGVNPAALDAIKGDPSYRGHQIFFQPGAKVRKTQNCFTWGGCVLLANRSEQAINSIYEK